MCGSSTHHGVPAGRAESVLSERFWSSTTLPGAAGRPTARRSPAVTSSPTPSTKANYAGGRPARASIPRDVAELRSTPTMLTARCSTFVARPMSRCRAAPCRHRLPQSLSASHAYRCDASHTTLSFAKSAVNRHIKIMKRTPTVMNGAGADARDLSRGGLTNPDNRSAPTSPTCRSFLDN